MVDRVLFVCVASPEVVAASALAGIIKAPGGPGANGLTAQGSVKVNSKSKGAFTPLSP
jgi:hypothetical protein